MSATVTEPEALATRTLADIATNLPGATAIFRRHKLDFCCGGGVALAEAERARGLAPGALAAELAELAPGAAPAAEQGTDELITLIETRYHAGHRRDLPELARLARRVEAVHRDHPDRPGGLAALLETMQRELEEHMEKEERILFPMMRRGGHPMIAQPIAVMLAEHDDHGGHLRALEALTGDFTAPDGACATWRALYVGLRQFAGELVEHIHTENNILFPRFTG